MADSIFNQKRNISLLIHIFSLFLKYFVGIYGYSGENDRPKYGDYEVQRHLTEWTYNLKPSEWYTKNNYNSLNYMKLNYPPLIGYYSWIWGYIFSYFFISVESKKSSWGYKSKNKIMMSVIVSDIIFFHIPVYLLSNWLLIEEREANKSETHNENKLDSKQMNDHINIKTNDNSNQKESNLEKNLLLNMRFNFFQFLFLWSPMLFIIDHGYFQYDCVMHGLFLLTLYFLYKNQVLVSIFTFCLCVNFKQTGIYYSMPLFFYVLKVLYEEKLKNERSLSIDEIHQKFKEQRKNEGNLSIDENSQQLKEQQKNERDSFIDEKKQQMKEKRKNKGKFHQKLKNQRKNEEDLSIDKNKQLKGKQKNESNSFIDKKYNHKIDEKNFNFLQKNNKNIVKNSDDIIICIIFKIILYVICTIMIMLIIWSPWISEKKYQDVLIIIFPLWRGIFEDKVASFWCTLDIFYKIQKVPQIYLIWLSFFLTLVPSLISCIAIFYTKDNKKIIKNTNLAFFIVSMSFFFFSFHVHKKTILVPFLAYLINYYEFPEFLFNFSFVGLFSFYPLLKRGKQIIPYTIFMISNFFLNETQKINKNELHDNSYENFSTKVFKNFPIFSKSFQYLEYFNVLFVIFYHVYEQMIATPMKYPCLYSMINSTFSFVNFFIFYLFALMAMISVIRDFKNNNTHTQDQQIYINDRNYSSCLIKYLKLPEIERLEGKTKLGQIGMKFYGKNNNYKVKICVEENLNIQNIEKIEQTVNNKTIKCKKYKQKNNQIRVLKKSYLII